MTEPDAPRLTGSAKQAAIILGRLDLHRRAIDELRLQLAARPVDVPQETEAPAPLMRMPADVLKARALAREAAESAREGDPRQGSILDPPPADDGPQVMWQLRDGSNLMSTRPGWMEQRSTADPISDPLGITP